jgi:hypothetical protein
MFRPSGALRHDCSGVMAADVEEAAHNFILAFDQENWLAGDIACDVFTGIADLVGAAGALPRAVKNRSVFYVKKSWVGIPR